MKSFPVKRFRFFVVLVILFVLAMVGLLRLRIDTDVVRTLPESDPVVAAGMYIFKNHPLQDRLFVDVTLAGGSRDDLVRLGDLVATEMRQSSLFERVGMDDFQTVFPELVTHTATHLPMLFTARELENDIGPRIAPGAIRERMAAVAKQLAGLEGIGQAQLITADPLGFKDLVLARMAPLAPPGDVRFYSGSLLDESGRHLLVMAVPRTSGTDTASARKIAALMTRIQDRARAHWDGTGKTVGLTPMGAYRVALDNETIVRRDVKNALTLATVGIAALLLLAFPRPLIGLMSLLPAVAGAVVALFVYSFWHESISIMVLGFGGAIISISVDHGIAYFLFADRPHQTRGRDAAREVWAIGLVAALTTVGAFGALTFSGFPVFLQLGQFTALGIGFSFLFVHTVLPLVMPSLPAAARQRQPLKPVADRLASTGKIGLGVAAVLFVGMAFFARPGFNVDLAAMNTVSPETRAAEKLMTDVWGDFLGERRIFMMVEADTVSQLLDAGDRLLARFEEDLDNDVLASVFVPSMITPGTVRSRQNLAAWQAFWQRPPNAGFAEDLRAAAVEAGFTSEAFDPFLATITGAPPPGGAPVSASGLAFFGVSASRRGNSWQQLLTLTTGPAYDPEAFFEKYRSAGRIFDPTFFPKRLGHLLSDSFRLMFLVVGVMTVVVLFFLFVDLSLTLIALLPVIFALVCTLGTLRLAGHPIDIPGLMLAIVIFGMGIDYAIFFVRAYQRYRTAEHDHFSLIRMAVLMASVSTLIGFGVLCGADHVVLKSAGFISLLGIGYALIGAFLILPPVLAGRFRGEVDGAFTGGTDLHARVRSRYKDMEAYPRMFARFKLLTDPMFWELPGLLPPDEDIRTVIDIGSGYGVPASWCLARYPNARVFGIDPDSERIRIAALAVGRRGTMSVGAAPDLPASDVPADCAFMLDMIHYLTDAELQVVLSRLRNRLVPGGKLLLRAVIPPVKKRPWLWWIENTRLRLLNIDAVYRTPAEIGALMTAAGFTIVHSGPSGSNGELHWLIGSAQSA